MSSTERFINNKNDLRTFLEAESKRYGIKNIKIPIFAISENQVLWKHIALLRKTEYYVNTGSRIVSLLYRYRLRNIQRKYCLRIPLNVFDCGLKIMHLGPVSASADARVGKHCTLHMYSALVAGGTNDYAPTLGDGIIVSIGAIILGNVILADNTVIGANALVNKSFTESDITIAGVPAKKISNSGSTTWRKDSRDKKNNEFEDESCSHH